jgi:SecD/SecF fusion protein
MQQKLTMKILLVIILLGLSFYSLYPTFQLNRIQGKETQLTNELMAATNLSKLDIEAALAKNELSSTIQKKVSEASRENALKVGDELSKVSQQVMKTEGKAIKLGLDLKGGTYLVYEADMPKLLLLPGIAKNADSRLQEIVKAAQKQYNEQGTDYFIALEQNFQSRNIPINRYYGKKGQTDEDIITELRKQAEDAVDRTLQIIRVRIDQFGVSEPSITKQGKNRIIVELAGIQNIQRAKNIIGSTALLEFKLVKDAQIVWSVLDDIDRVLKTKRSGLTTAQPAPAAADTAKTKEGKTAQEKEVNIGDLFGNNEKTETGETKQDTTVLVDQKTFEEKPFTALLRQIGGGHSNMISVPMQNVSAVQRILQLPEVEAAIPSDTQFLWKDKPLKMGETSYQTLFLVKKDPELLGNTLTDAKVQVGAGAASLRGNEPEVHMTLNSEGTKTFARVTGNNVGKQLAIVLDSKVASAPNINEKIPSGSASITGMRDMDEAKDLALVLRAGALDAAVEVITENTVGPSLGADSIKKGGISFIVSFSIVVLFMVLYYNAAGVVADFALVLNIIMMMGVFAAFHFTLTLPGIAGIILTVGMAVDANVLINERIREELRTGKTIRASIDAGYKRAFVTILDSNLTTLISAVALYNFGTGSVKGFALSLSIGLIISMFTSIAVTRLVYDFITSRYAIKRLSI